MKVHDNEEGERQLIKILVELTVKFNAIWIFLGCWTTADNGKWDTKYTQRMKMNTQELDQMGLSSQGN